MAETSPMLDRPSSLPGGDGSVARSKFAYIGGGSTRVPAASLYPAPPRGGHGRHECVSNTSIIDFEGDLRPAAYA
jgi:hypothetical protein